MKLCTGGRLIPQLFHYFSHFSGSTDRIVICTLGWQGNNKGDTEKAALQAEVAFVNNKKNINKAKKFTLRGCQLLQPLL